MIVTAQKRDENIQTIPLAISALTADELQQKNISSFDGVATATPSISFTPYPSSSNTLILFMRGQGLDDPGQITRDGAVGLYEDGFYIARPQTTTFDLADVERVEVLRGPQGTLYGRNTTGGAVVLISKQPRGKFGFKQDFTVGSRNQFRSLTAIDLPRWKNISTKITLLKRSIDGYVKNAGDGRDYGEQAQLGGRAAFHWDAGANFYADYFYESGELNSTPMYQSNPLLNGMEIVPGTAYYAPNGRPSRTYRAIDLKLSTSRFEGNGLTLTWDVDEALSIKSLTGYRKLDYRAYQDYAEAFGYSFNSDDSYRQHQFSQEFQFVGSTLDDRLNYVAGLYYFKEGGAHLGIFPDADFSHEVSIESKSRALFGQATWTPAILEDQLSITLGARYTKDDKSASRISTASGVVLEDGDTPTPAAPEGASNNQHFSRFNPTFTVDYRWSEDISTYAKVSTGYKAGGSLESQPVGQFDKTFGPENLLNYELGLKSYWFDHRLRLNATAFHSKYKDIQLQLFTDPNNLAVLQAYNAGEATIEGIELESLYSPQDDFSLSFNGSYMKWRVDKARVIAGTILDRNVPDSTSPYQPGDNVNGLFAIFYTPKYSFNIGADYIFAHFSGGEAAAHLDYLWHGQMYSNPGDGPDVPGRQLDTVPSYGLFNGRLTLTLDLPHGDLAKISLWGKNITRKNYYQSSGGMGGGLTSFQTLPSGDVVPAGYTARVGTWAEPPSWGFGLTYEY